MLHLTIRKTRVWLVSAILATILAMTGCKAPTTTTTTPPTTTPPATSAAGPTITIIAPGNGVIPVPGNVAVTVQVANFKLVEKQGQPAVAGEGHIHYFLDVDAPTTPGQPAVPPNGSWAHTANTSYTFTNVTGGQHKISVELVNNDHTPLVPPVVAAVNFLVLQEIGPPNLVIATPRDGEALPAGDLTVTIQASNFNIVDKQGQANVSREGHVHYYLDVDAPTTPGQPAIPPSGVWAHVATTSYTFTNVAPGAHTISVELVNNDHTPLEPPVVKKITVNVSSPSPTPTGAPVTINLSAQNFSFSPTTITVPAGAIVTINFNNQDSGVLHNFSLYADSSAPPPALFQGGFITGPSTVTYKFTAPSKAGTYFFRCDIHPTTMTGTFIVQ